MILISSVVFIFPAINGFEVAANAVNMIKNAKRKLGKCSDRKIKGFSALTKFTDIKTENKIITTKSWLLFFVLIPPTRRNSFPHHKKY